MLTASSWRLTVDRALSQVLLRRGELLGRIRQQRAEVAALAAQMEPALTLADRGLSLWRRAGQHPYVVAGVTALVLWRRRGLSGLLRSGFRLWRGWRFFSAFRKSLFDRLTAD